MMSNAYPNTNVQFIVGTLPDGRVLLDFETAKVDHLKLTQTQALDLAEALVEATRQVGAHGRVILTPNSPLA